VFAPDTQPLFWDFSTRFLDLILCFLYYCACEPDFGRFAHNQGQAFVGLFQLYTTSLLCHSSRHVENIQEISSCFKQCDSSGTSTIFASVASYRLIDAWFVHSQGYLSGNSSLKIPELTISWCSIWQTARANTFIDHAGFPLWSTIFWSCCSLGTPAICYMVHCPRFTTFWYTHKRTQTASYSCCLPSYTRFSLVHPGEYFCWLYWQCSGG